MGNKGTARFNGFKENIQNKLYEDLMLHKVVKWGGGMAFLA